MDLESLLTYLDQHGVRKVKLAGTDLDGVLRGKYVSLEKFRSAAKSGFGFCDVLFGWDVQDEPYDWTGMTGWETGFPDLLAKVDAGTMRVIPWEPGTAFFLADFWSDDTTPYPVCPRNLLKSMVARAEGQGYHPRASVEYEFWIFRETAESIQEKGFRNLTPHYPGRFGYSVLRANENSQLVHDLMDACAAMNVNLEGLHTETGPGVWEAAIGVQDAVEAADRAVLFKTVAKEICARHDCRVTFMARWAAEQAGSSGHLHASLWNPEATQNLFSDPQAPGGRSLLMQRFMGGQLALMAELMPMVCPTINSYKRTVPGAWAPMNVGWGEENRTAALRAIRGQSGSSTRVEYRLAGADANPYLALSAALGSGLWGVEHESELPPATRGNAYENKLEALPRTLEAAAERFRRSEAVRTLFGGAFVDHFAATRDWEVRRFQQAVTDWELRRYFEVI